MTVNSQPSPIIPPLRDGVGASRVQVPVGDWASVAAFLDARFPAVGVAVWQSRCERGLVLGADGRTLAASDACRNGDTIYYYRELAQETVIPFAERILYRDDQLLVADKPHFLPVLPSGRFVQQTLLVRLKQATGIATLSPLHRIDKDTAGLVLFSVNPATRDAYQALFRTRAVQKTYLAVAPLLPGIDGPLRYRSRLVQDEQFFRTREVPGEANSETMIALLQQRDGLALYRLQPVSGRKHQLRVQLAALGVPIVNDVLYPAVQPVAADDFSRPLQLLAQSLAFDDPLSGEPRRFSSTLSLQGWP